MTAIVLSGFQKSRKRSEKVESRLDNLEKDVTDIKVKVSNLEKGVADIERYPTTKKNLMS